jgi:hypothetical protein
MKDLIFALRKRVCRTSTLDSMKIDIYYRSLNTGNFIEHTSGAEESTINILS